MNSSTLRSSRMVALKNRRVSSRIAARKAAAPAAVTTAEHHEFQVALEDALQELPETFRTVFLLRDGGGSGRPAPAGEAARR